MNGKIKIVLGGSMDAWKQIQFLNNAFNYFFMGGGKVAAYFITRNA